MKNILHWAQVSIINLSKISLMAIGNEICLDKNDLVQMEGYAILVEENLKRIRKILREEK